MLDGNGAEFRRRVRARQPAHLGAARRHSRLRAEGVHRRRGPALLPASRRRRARHHPRLHRQSRRTGPAAGRLDHHPAGGEEPAGRRGRDLRAQDPRDDRGVAARKHAEQERDSRALSQLRLSRPRLVGRRDGRAQLFRQIGEGPHARRRRHAGRPAQGAELLQSRPPSRSRQGASRLCARPHAGRRRHHRGAEGPGARRAAEARRLRAPAPRQRLRLRRFSRPRGEGRRRREPDGAIPTRCTRPSMRNCSATPKRRCRKAWRTTRSSTGRVAVSRAGSQHRRRRAEAVSGRQRQARARRLGSRRCRPRTCRSTTCIGRRPWCVQKGEQKRQRRDPRRPCPTAASCR